MIEFSRKHQEEKLVKEQEDELRQLTEDEVDLEVSQLSYQMYIVAFVVCHKSYLPKSFTILLLSKGFVVYLLKVLRNRREIVTTSNKSINFKQSPKLFVCFLILGKT